MKHPFVLACCLLVGTAAAGWSAPAPSQVTVSLELKDTPLHRALDLLFSQSGLQYSIDADVPDSPITLKVHEMPFTEALRALLRLGSTTFAQGPGMVQQGVTYRKEGDLYQIGLRRSSPEPGPGGFGGFGGGPGGFGGGPGGFGGGFGGAGGTPLQVVKIPINFLRPDEAASYLGGQPSPPGIRSIQPIARDNALIVRGEHDAIEELKNLVELVDVPLPPLSVSVGISGPGVNGAPLSIRSSARSLIGDAVTIDEGATTGGRPAHLKVRLQTQRLGNGDLQVASDWDVSVPIAGGPKGPIRLVKRLSTTTQLRPGEQVSVAEVDLSGWGGKGVLRLWLRGDWDRHASPSISR